MRAFRLSHPARKSAAFQQVRHFHPTRPTPFISEALELSSAYLHTVHDVTHLPWALSIPLSALIVRTTVAMPLQIYSKLQAHRERDTIPLLLAWQQVIRNETIPERDRDYPTVAQKQAAIRESAAKRQYLFRRVGIGRFWRLTNFLQVPIWISVMESLRAMSGNDRGLVAWLLSWIRPESAELATPPAIEPSFATEGALWFPDLLAGDPTGILPLALTMSILFNVHMGWKTKPLRSLAELPKMAMYRELSFRGLRFFIQVLALNVGLSSFVSEMPTALMIYWITSTNTATLQTFVLDRFLLPVKPFTPWTPRFMLYKPEKKAPSPPSPRVLPKKQ
ncbi:putative mitochondrial export translocase Oxa2 [Aspergillus ibericus CBS 121593]|uniref:Mitochondrial export translocase Oxa2 n=1 Tax=Aspergillus ibericus CBS 121593 TaxID=1448316 RepID=A0A395GS46_9EURO|nr:mitochondrial export translocase Oxa2 [Aspergillus ibericus CBS 121593]RAK98400.1 mitochondrial export translocase Oxa2 [Aspergillus ibericus CBS 121593]